MKSKLKLFVLGFVVFEALFAFALLKPKQPETQQIVNPVQIQPPAPQFPVQPKISNPIPGYQNYPAIVTQLDEWKRLSPGLVETGTYGKTSRGQSLYYIRVTNLYDQTPKKKVLITACIHGNEPLATSTTMGFIGTMLSTYQTDAEVTELINTRDIYFVPVVSPDSYPNSREVDGVDPNRNFPSPSNPNRQSVAPISAIQQFFLQHRFNAVISGHTFGRVYLIPYGDTTQNCPNYSDFLRITDQMRSISHYRVQRCCEMYGQPIFGTEVDWYYRHGAFAIVSEYGTHQRIPSMDDTRTEFNMTYRGVLTFIRLAPEVQVSVNVLSETSPWWTSRKVQFFSVQQPLLK